MGMKYHAIWQAFMAAYITLCGGLLSVNAVPTRVTTVMVILGGAMQAGTTAYYASTNRMIVPGASAGQGSNPPP